MNSELNYVENTHRNLDKISNRMNEDDDVIINNLYTIKNKNKDIAKNNEKLNTIRKPINQTFIKGTRNKKEVKFNLNSTDKIVTNSLNLQQII